MIALPVVGVQDPLQPKRRRLVGKQPGIAVPVPQQAAVSRCGRLWQHVRAADFYQADRRRKYRTVYNKFEWWFGTNPVLTFGPQSWCSQQLWNLARSDWKVLTKPQKSMVLRFSWT